MALAQVRTRWLAVALASVTVPLAGAARLTPPSVAPAAIAIRVTPLVTEGRVSVSIAATDALNDDGRGVIKSGVPLTFTYQIELRRPSMVWWDRTVGSAVVSASVKFDNLMALYQVTKQQDGHVTSSKSTSKEEEMRIWTTDFPDVPVKVIEPLEPNVDYYVQVRLQERPRVRFSLWPWGRDDGSGRAEFTYIK